ncbi:hypothetical protein BP5796_13105 [Coleophoma crateriformis]|uniref:Uncharacterized protein n=1 Tax=Coleophoma crateriformis TaxID=565419 RepID=A0A3D8Q4P4_9HELO|nr:hypothetical protein BP5796_13105 [Coleophoma crateriformis]
MATYWTLLPAVLLCTTTLAFPTSSDGSLVRKATLDCSPSSTAGIQPECWAQLNVTNYINEWMVANSTAANCDTLGFAQCFLEFNGFGGRTCNLLTRGTCDAFETISATYYSPQQFYALWNIYAIYQYFNQFSEGLSNAESLASDTVGKIVSTISPAVTEPQTPSTLLWTVLSGGFWLIAASPVTPALAIINTGLAVVTGMSSFFMNAISGTANSRFVALGEISSELAQLVIDYQASLETALTHLQGNSTLFIAAAEPGGFSSRAVTSLNLQSINLFHDLELFVISLALQANGIVSARSTGVNVVDFAPSTNGAIDCPSLGVTSNCSQFWYDEAAGNTYALHNPNDWGNQYTDVLSAIQDNQWANLSEIFQVENCAGKQPGFDGTKVSCLATHNYCEWAYQNQIDPYAANAAKKQFENCNNDGTWGYACSSFTIGLEVPQSYLGPLLTNDQYYCYP